MVKTAAIFGFFVYSSNIQQNTPFFTLEHGLARGGQSTARWVFLYGPRRSFCTLSTQIRCKNITAKKSFS